MLLVAQGVDRWTLMNAGGRRSDDPGGGWEQLPDGGLHAEANYIEPDQCFSGETKGRSVDVHRFTSNP